MASGISAAPRGPAQGGEPGRSASCKAWQVQTWVFIKCPGGAGWAQMLLINGITWRWGRCREAAGFVVATQGGSPPDSSYHTLWAPGWAPGVSLYEAGGTHPGEP